MNNKESSIPKKTWKITDVVTWTTQYFKDHNISSARLDAELLLANVLDIKRLNLYLEFDRILKKEELDEYKSLIKKRAEYIPVAYLIGKKEFMGLDFCVDENVLIPRPETEILVETAINKIKEHFIFNADQHNEMDIQPGNMNKDSFSNQMPYIVDLGVGSGNIAVTLAKYIKHCKIYAIDVNQKCLEIALNNSKKNKVDDKITFLLGDLFYPLEGYALKNKVDLIISNPPYVKTADFNELSLEVKNEPRSALIGGDDGLDFYRKIIPQSLGYLNEKGYLMLEIGYGQAEEIICLMKESGLSDIQTIKDYAGIDRVLVGKKNVVERQN